MRFASIIGLIVLIWPTAAIANVAPVATDSEKSVVEASVRDNLWLQVSDADGQFFFTYQATSLPSHGLLEFVDYDGATGGSFQVLSLNTTVGSGYWVYSPDPGYVGSDSFTWLANDGLADSNQATVTITVTGNTPPTATDQEFSLVQGSTRQGINLDAVDPDYAQPFSYTLLSAPAHGTLEFHDNRGYVTLSAGQSGTSNYWLFTPDPAYSGADSFAWKVSDSLAESETSTVSITISPNTAPLALEAKRAVAANQPATFAAPYSDPDAIQSRTLVIVTQPAHGSVSITGLSFTYTPGASFFGTDSFSWNIDDGVDLSNTATFDLLVRSPDDPAGMLVLLVVNQLLLPEISTEIDRLKTDLETEGYTARIQTFPSTGTAQGVWDLLKIEYDVPNQFVAGAILIGQIPRAKNTVTNEQTDLVYWNMSDFRDVGEQHIWVSRIWAANQWGNDLSVGTEIDLIKRALQANHDYRTGISRLPHTAFHYYDVGGSPDTGLPSRALEIWPEATVPTHVSDAFIAGGELINETSHGGAEIYDKYGPYPRTQVTNSSVMEMLAQVRFVCVSSCSSGRLGGVANHQLFSRGGGNVLSIAATTTTYTGAFEMLDGSLRDQDFRSLLAAGESWGGALTASYPFDDRYRTIFYGDLSLSVMVSPPNSMPVIDSFSADLEVGSAPLSVHFSAAASDADGTIAEYEWFPAGHDYGKALPTASGSTITSLDHVYTLPHRYLARLQVIDNHKAIAWQVVEIVVGPQPGQPLRVNVGGINSWNQNPLNRAVECYRPGEDYLDQAGQLWLHDQDAVTGTWGATAASGGGINNSVIQATVEPHLFQRYRTAQSNAPTIAYTVPLENGDYTLKLGFADLLSTAAGQRVIDANVEGQPWLVGFEPYVEVGPNTAIWKTTFVTVSDGALDFVLKKSAAASRYPLLNAFEVIPDGVVNQLPTATATANPQVGALPLQVSFDGSSSSDIDGSIVSFDWDFGDGSSGTGSNVNHTFTAAGLFTAVLTVTDDTGGIGTDSIAITVADPNNALPTASIIAPVSTGFAPLPVTFSGGNSTDTDGSIIAYDWDFGDSFTGAGINVGHTYVSPGNYTVQLTVTDDSGGTDVALLLITVDQAPNIAPTAVAAACCTEGWAPFEIEFWGGQSTDVDGYIDSHSWDFGDGGTAQTENAVHTFIAAGSYLVRLTVTDDLGASATDTLEITVSSSTNLPPNAVASAVPTIGDAPLEVAFDAAGSVDSDGTINAADWAFGDGSTGTGLQVIHAFVDPGLYSVLLTVTDNDGAPGQDTITITVLDPANQPPAALVSATPEQGGAPLQVILSGAASSDSDGSIASYAWDLGDGETGGGVQVLHTYTEPGTYTVVMTVTDDANATASAQVDVTVFAPTDAGPVDGGDLPNDGGVGAGDGDSDPVSDPGEPPAEVVVRSRVSCNAGLSVNSSLLAILLPLLVLARRRRRRNSASGYASGHARGSAFTRGYVVWLVPLLAIVFGFTGCTRSESGEQSVEEIFDGATNASEVVIWLEQRSHPSAERRAALIRLARTDDRRAPELLMAVGDIDTYFSWAAVEALGHLPQSDARVHDYLVRRLRYDDVRIAVAAARSVAKVRGPDTVVHLSAAISASRERPDGHGEMIALAAIHALAAMGARGAVPELRAELERVDHSGWNLDYGSEIVEALLQIGGEEGQAAVSRYADALSVNRPDDPMAGPYYDTKIHEARRAALDL